MGICMRGRSLLPLQRNDGRSDARDDGGGNGGGGNSGGGNGDGDSGGGGSGNNGGDEQEPCILSFFISSLSGM